MRISVHMARAMVLGAISALGAGQVLAQDSATLHQRATAAACANCHGTDGRGVTGSAVPSLAGMPKGYMITQMKAFRDGSRQATVMHQLAKGLTEQQIESMADYFAAVKR
jgi:sulfide dehydrogenase cytochrome subunit